MLVIQHNRGRYPSHIPVTSSQEGWASHRWASSLSHLTEQSEAGEVMPVPVVEKAEPPDAERGHERAQQAA